MPARRTLTGTLCYTPWWSWRTIRRKTLSSSPVCTTACWWRRPSWNPQWGWRTSPTGEGWPLSKWPPRWAKSKWAPQLQPIDLTNESPVVLVQHHLLVKRVWSHSNPTSAQSHQLSFMPPLAVTSIYPFHTGLILQSMQLVNKEWTMLVLSLNKKFNYILHSVIFMFHLDAFCSNLACCYSLCSVMSSGKGTKEQLL